MPYVYAHINPNTNKVFYVGVSITKEDRIIQTKARPIEWTNEVKKIGGISLVKK